MKLLSLCMSWLGNQESHHDYQVLESDSYKSLKASSKHVAASPSRGKPSIPVILKQDHYLILGTSQVFAFGFFSQMQKINLWSMFLSGSLFLSVRTQHNSIGSERKMADQSSWGSLALFELSHIHFAVVNMLQKRNFSHLKYQNFSEFGGLVVSRLHHYTTAKCSGWSSDG